MENNNDCYALFDSFFGYVHSHTRSIVIASFFRVYWRVILIITGNICNTISWLVFSNELFLLVTGIIRRLVSNNIFMRSQQRLSGRKRALHLEIVKLRR